MQTAPDEVTLGIEWAPIPGKCICVIHRQAGLCVGRFDSYAQAEKALPRIARKLLRCAVVPVTVSDERGKDLVAE